MSEKPKHRAIERECLGTWSVFCDCGFGENDPKDPDTIMNHIFQLEYMKGIASDPTYKKWTGFKKGSYFNPEKKEDKQAKERISRAMAERLTEMGTAGKDEKEAGVEESVKPIISKIEEKKDERIRESGSSGDST